MQGKDGDLFSVFSEQLSKIIEGRESLALEHVLGMQASLIQLALTCYKEESNYIDKILQTTADIISQYLVNNNLKEQCQQYFSSGLLAAISKNRKIR